MFNKALFVFFLDAWRATAARWGPLAAGIAPPPSTAGLSLLLLDRRLGASCTANICLFGGLLPQFSFWGTQFCCFIDNGNYSSYVIHHVIPVWGLFC